MLPLRLQDVSFLRILQPPAVITARDSADIWLAVSRRSYQVTTAGTSCAIGSSSE